jgi:predicted metal-binding protein
MAVATARSEAREPRRPVMTTTVFVCTSCRRNGQEDDVLDRPGRALVRAIEARHRADGQATFAVAAVDCLAVCKRPCTVALCGQDKWTYLIGDIDPDVHVVEIIAAAASYAASGNGIVPWRERPQFFRKGVIARVPPLSHKELP